VSFFTAYDVQMNVDLPLRDMTVISDVLGMVGGKHDVDE